MKELDTYRWLIDSVVDDLCIDDNQHFIRHW